MSGNGGTTAPATHMHRDLPSGMRLSPGRLTGAGRIIVSADSYNGHASLYFTADDIRALVQFAEDCAHERMVAAADEFLRGADAAAAALLGQVPNG